MPKTLFFIRRVLSKLKNTVNDRFVCSLLSADMHGAFVVSKCTRRLRIKVKKLPESGFQISGVSFFMRAF